MKFSRFVMLVALIWLWWRDVVSLLNCLCYVQPHSSLCSELHYIL